ncbi:MAG: hypothetical protein K1X47_11170 [Cyclobacteriaceae bacterium]|nr:hypothetical protein [Cyclobacteriaceae bacterium]
MRTVVILLLALLPVLGVAQESVSGSSDSNGEEDNSIPLYVVDGKVQEHLTIYMGNDLRKRHIPVDQLNPYDVETVAGMRGEKAVAIFGDKAKNGVVIITTRRSLRRSFVAEVRKSD